MFQKELVIAPSGCEIMFPMCRTWGVASKFTGITPKRCFVPARGQARFPDLLAFCRFLNLVIQIGVLFVFDGFSGSSGWNGVGEGKSCLWVITV